MSIHYLIDPFTTAGDITDVITSETGQTETTGATVVRVPDGVAIHNDPTNLIDLLTAKYDGLLASYAGFTDILADSCMDTSNWDLASSALRFIAGAGFVHHCFTPFGSCHSVSIPLGFAPTQCVVVWEEYSFVDSDIITDRFKRTYTEVNAPLSCSISFDSLAHSDGVSNGEVLNIPVAHQGTSFVIQFINSTADRVYLGSWALLYL